MKKISDKKHQFNEFRFDGLNARQCSNKYLTMKRVSDDETKIVVKVGDSHIVPTKFGYALILDNTHVVFLKNWQVSCNYYGNEVLLDKQYFKPKQFGEWLEFVEYDENCEFKNWLKVAQAQADLKDEDGDELNPVRWEI